MRPDLLALTALASMGAVGTSEAHHVDRSEYPTLAPILPPLPRRGPCGDPGPKRTDPDKRAARKRQKAARKANRGKR